MDNIQITNNSTTSSTSVTPANIHVKNERSFSNIEVLFAWFCYLAGYLLCRVVPLSKNSFGGFLLILALFVVTIVVLAIKKVKFNIMSWLAAASACITSTSLILSTNDTLIFFAYMYSLATYCYFVYTATGNSLKNGLSDMISADLINALFAYPFRSFEQMIRAMFSNKSSKSSRIIIRSLLGLAIAFIPTAIVLGLLSYDSGFWNLFKKLFDFSLENVFSHIVSLVFAVPLGMYFFGLFISSSDKDNTGAITRESCSKAAVKMRIAPVVTIVTAILPLIFIYILFFMSQWRYYVSGFTGILPSEFSYAEYAREGFFQLCTVSVINLAIILAVILFMRRSLEHSSILLKVITIVFSVFTLILISTAVAKMIMYIECYGLTQKRVYATWLMAVLAIVFILIIVKQFIPKLNAVAASLMVCILLFSALALSNADSIIVNYNVNRYLNGSLKTIDVHSTIDMGDAAIPGLVHLAEELDKRNDTNIAEGDNSIDTSVLRTENETLYETLRALLHSYAMRFKNIDNEYSMFEFNLPAVKAKNELQRIGLLNE